MCQSIGFVNEISLDMLCQLHYTQLASWMTIVDFTVIHRMKVKSRVMGMLHGDLHLIKFVSYMKYCFNNQLNCDYCLIWRFSIFETITTISLAITWVEIHATFTWPKALGNVSKLRNRIAKIHATVTWPKALGNLSKLRNRIAKIGSKLSSFYHLRSWNVFFFSNLLFT